MATTRVTNVWREDVTEPNPDVRVTRVYAEALGASIDVRVTRVYVEVLTELQLPPVPAASLVPIIIVNSL